MKSIKNKNRKFLKSLVRPLSYGISIAVSSFIGKIGYNLIQSEDDSFIDILVKNLLFSMPAIFFLLPYASIAEKIIKKKPYDAKLEIIFTFNKLYHAACTISGSDYFLRDEHVRTIFVDFNDPRFFALRMNELGYFKIHLDPLSKYVISKAKKELQNNESKIKVSFVINGHGDKNTPFISNGKNMELNTIFLAPVIDRLLSDLKSMPNLKISEIDLISASCGSASLSRKKPNLQEINTKSMLGLLFHSLEEQTRLSITKIKGCSDSNAPLHHPQHQKQPQKTLCKTYMSPRKLDPLDGSKVMIFRSQR